jgi:hypothetical protein
MTSVGPISPGTPSALGVTPKAQEPKKEARHRVSPTACRVGLPIAMA